MIVKEDGHFLKRILDDGRMVFVTPLTYGRARITIGNEHTLDDGW